MKTTVTYRNGIAGIFICILITSSIIQIINLPETEKKIAVCLGLITFMLVSLMARAFVIYEHWSRGNLKRIALCVFGMGILVHFWGFIECWRIPIPTALLHSIIASVEMFFSESNLGNIILENPEIRHSAIYVALYIFVYSAAISVSLFYLFLVFGQRIKSRIWLEGHKIILVQEQSYWHIMFGINENTIALAKDLLNSKKDANHVIFIEEPDEKGAVKLSLANIAEFFSISNTAEGRLQKRLKCTERVSLLTMSKSLREAHDKYQDKSLSTTSFCQLIGLEDLEAWLSYKCASNVHTEKHDNDSLSKDHFEKPKVSLYIIGESENDNRVACHAFMSLIDINCRIYCHAQRKDVVLYPDCATDNDMLVEYVDSAHLAIEQLKKEKEVNSDNRLFHPVNYVDIDRDKGCVTSTFTAMLLGFGQTGQEALDFLYSYGAFVGEDHNRSSYELYVYDDHLPEREGEYRAARPGMDYSKIFFHNTPVGTSTFWDQFTHVPIRGSRKTALNECVNYIIVCMGNDELNIRTGIELCEWICCKRAIGNPNNQPMVAVHVRNASGAVMQKISFYQKKFIGFARLEIFGQREKIWSYDIITNYSLYKQASEYYRLYLYAAGFPIKESFTSRNRKIEKEIKLINSFSGKEYRASLNLIYKSMRQEAQDIENCLHQYTKRQLCNSDYHDLASLIPVISAALHKEGEKSLTDDWMEHFPTTQPGIPTEILKKAGIVFENLAIGEHIRWTASHETLGYTFGMPTDEILKRHCYITPYSDLSGEVKHYDWIVVKTSLPKRHLSNSELNSQE